MDSVQRKGIPMQHTPRSVSARAQSVICVLAVTVGLTVAPSLVTSASAEQSFGKQLPPKPTPGKRNEGPIRGSLPTPRRTLSTSAPVPDSPVD